MEIVLRALPITAEFYGWTNSTIVLHQIQAVNKSHKTFVANRLTSIRSAIPPDRWYHIDGKLNPADRPSRGIPAAELFQNSTWFSGPGFLRQEWEMNGGNNSLLTPPKPDTSTLEKLQEEEKGHVQLLATTVSFNLHCKIPDVKFLFGNDPRTFPYSSWNRLIRHTCLWIRGFHNLYRSPENRITGDITVTEREQAIHRWICCIQLQAFSAEIHCLQANAPLPKGSPLKTLCPFVDDSGALRVGGRLAKSDLDFNNKHPLLLPRHPVTELIIEAHHVKLQHAGLQALRYALQEKYWILPGKRLFKRSLENVNPVKSSMQYLCSKKCLIYHHPE
ncbi:unnamed protein product [Allacma fusca]|uniref:Integrase zinc-binding domain-containing protein n=1 Tax=Allacma fusca TaxID=39272 RepID=A0A8J2PWJ1_9HEXA|nr:unnamed protein product [Allacma fusca]